MSLPAQHFYLELKIKNKSNVNSNVEDIVITKNNIEELTIREDVLSILPRIEIVINDVGGLVDSFPILDEDVMSVVVSQFEDDVPVIDMEFIISDLSFDGDSGSNHF